MVVVWNCSRDSGWRREQREEMEEYAAWSAEIQAKADNEKIAMEYEKRRKEKDRREGFLRQQSKRKKDFYEKYNDVIQQKIENNDYVLLNVPENRENMDDYIDTIVKEFIVFLDKYIKDFKKILILFDHETYKILFDCITKETKLLFTGTELLSVDYPFYFDFLFSECRKKLYEHFLKIYVDNNENGGEEYSSLRNSIEKIVSKHCYPIDDECGKIRNFIKETVSNDFLIDFKTNCGKGIKCLILD